MGNSRQNRKPSLYIKNPQFLGNSNTNLFLFSMTFASNKNMLKSC